MKKRIEVVGAVIVRDGLVFCTRRGPGTLEGYWEFPGGKLEPGESQREALVREVWEELRCTITVGAEVATTEHEYDFAVIVLTTFSCTLDSGEPQLLEHTEAAWVAPKDLATLRWAPADLPAIHQLQTDLA